MRSLLPILGLVLAGVAYAGGNPVLHVHRCVSARGALSYQQQPCASDSREAKLVVLDLRAPPVPVQAKPARAERPERRTRARRGRGAKAGTARPAPIPLCPATREHPGDSGLSGLKSAWKQRIELPGETYLKNAGQWPKHCIRR